MLAQVRQRAEIKKGGRPWPKRGMAGPGKYGRKEGKGCEYAHHSKLLTSTVPVRTCEHHELLMETSLDYLHWPCNLLFIQDWKVSVG